LPCSGINDGLELKPSKNNEIIPQENNEMIFVSASKRSNGIPINSPEKTEDAMSKSINLNKVDLQISSQKK